MAPKYEQFHMGTPDMEIPLFHRLWNTASDVKDSRFCSAFQLCGLETATWLTPRATSINHMGVLTPAAIKSSWGVPGANTNNQLFSRGCRSASAGRPCKTVFRA